MWHTSEGDRILCGAEAELFRAGVLALVECVKVEADEDTDYGIALFDELTWTQRLAVLEQIASCLLSAAERIPQLTAVNEATIGAVFERISLEIDQEIDDEPPATIWRQLVLDACCESFFEQLQDRISDDSGDEDEACFPSDVTGTCRDQWHSTVQMLADRILWDRDFEMMCDFLDEPPEKAAVMREIMGIDDDYFAVAADDLASDVDVRTSLHRLDQILRQPLS